MNASGERSEAPPLPLSQTSTWSPRLCSLSMCSEVFTAEAVQQLADACGGLAHLSMADCVFTNTHALQGLTRLTCLTSLALEDAPVSASLLDALVQLPRLRVLVATGSGVKCNVLRQRDCKDAAPGGQQLAALSLQGAACTDAAVTVRRLPSSVLPPRAPYALPVMIEWRSLPWWSHGSRHADYLTALAAHVVSGLAARHE